MQMSPTTMRKLEASRSDMPTGCRDLQPSRVPRKVRSSALNALFEAEVICLLGARANPDHVPAASGVAFGGEIPKIEGRTWAYLVFSGFAGCGRRHRFSFTLALKHGAIPTVVNVLF